MQGPLCIITGKQLNQLANYDETKKALHALIQRGPGCLDPHLENHKHIGFLSNTDPDPLNIIKLPSHNLGSSSARQRNAIKMAFR